MAVFCIYFSNSVAENGLVGADGLQSVDVRRHETSGRGLVKNRLIVVESDHRVPVIAIFVIRPDRFADVLEKGGRDTKP